MTAAWAGPDDAYLLPGETYLSRGQHRRVITLLGSCVAVVLHSARHRRSAICHAVLPRAREPGAANPRFVDQAIDLMLDALHRERIPVTGLQAKLFGGATQLARAPARPSAFDVGRKNVCVARRELERHGIGLVAQDVGGRHGRRLCLFPVTGEVRLYRI